MLVNNCVTSIQIGLVDNNTVTNCRRKQRAKLYGLGTILQYIDVVQKDIFVLITSRRTL